MAPGFSFILGMDSIRTLRGVTVDPQGSVRFGIEDEICAAADLELKVDEPDFTATYDPRRNYWTTTIGPKWAEGKKLGVLHNQAAEYTGPRDARELYKKELQGWIGDEWLLLYDEQMYGLAKGLIPLMAVVQWNKRKVQSSGEETM